MVEPPTGRAGHAGEAAAPVPEARPQGWRATRKERPGHELLCEQVFRPLAQVVVRALLPLRVAPTAVVVVHAMVGLVAAALVWRGSFVAAALLLQLKTVLDNADGQLARASGKVTDLGRYLDTECDALVNVALFVALGQVTGQAALAIVALLVLTLVLSVDYNLDLLYKEARLEGSASPAPGRAAAGLAGVPAQIYRAVFAPQDRLVRLVHRRRLERLLVPGTPDVTRRRTTVAYNDGMTVTIVANLGLSTQLAVLGVLLVVGVPSGYLWAVVGCGLALPLLQVRREHRARATLRG